MDRRSLVTAALAILLLAGCALTAPPIDHRLGVVGPSGGTLYPGARVDCVPSIRCDDMRGEIDRWVARSAPTRGPVLDVSFHGFIDESGGIILMNRSGGGTWLAVVTLADGGRIGLSVGCGVGISPEVCFANP